MATPQGTVYKMGGNEGGNKGTTNNIYLTKPAKRQVKKGSGPKAEMGSHSSEYNIWFNKRLGDRFVKEERIKASTRCNVSTDSGYTKANTNPGSNKHSYICLYFARGHCHHGPDCSFLHRIPTVEDNAQLDLAHDVFGRERHRSYKDDMTGVGSFSRDNKTLYITGVKRASTTEDTLMRHFIEFGELEYVRIIWDKAIGFVKFKLRAAAEFAKEAMQDQSLDHDELLHIKWSNEDPNPIAKETEFLQTQNQLIQAMEQKRTEMEQQYQYNVYNENLGGEETSVDYFPSQHNPKLYPNTDSQYQYQNQDPSYQYYQDDQNQIQTQTQPNEEQTTTESESKPKTGNESQKKGSTNAAAATNSYSNSQQIVSEWLSDIGLEQYTESLISGNYTDLETLSQLDEVGLDATGVTNADHRGRILAAVEDLKEELNQKEQQRLQQEKTSFTSAQNSYYQHYASYYQQYYPDQQVGQGQGYIYTNEEYNPDNENANANQSYDYNSNSSYHQYIDKQKKDLQQHQQYQQDYQQNQNQNSNKRKQVQSTNQSQNKSKSSNLQKKSKSLVSYE